MTVTPMELIDTFFNWSILVRSFPILIRGLGNTILLGCASIVFGGIAGLAVCLVRLYAPKALRRLAILYIDIFRALPILVVLILIYYALPFIGIRLSSFVSATLALSMVLAAFTAEVCRAGICLMANRKPASSPAPPSMRPFCTSSSRSCWAL